VSAAASSAGALSVGVRLAALATTAANATAEILGDLTLSGQLSVTVDPLAVLSQTNNLDGSGSATAQAVAEILVGVGVSALAVGNVVVVAGLSVAKPLGASAGSAVSVSALLDLGVPLESAVSILALTSADLVYAVEGGVAPHVMLVLSDPPIIVKADMSEVIVPTDYLTSKVPPDLVDPVVPEYRIITADV
jgi:hypothetical protein